MSSINLTKKQYLDLLKAMDDYDTAQEALSEYEVKVILRKERFSTDEVFSPQRSE